METTLEKPKVIRRRIEAIQMKKIVELNDLSTRGMISDLDVYIELIDDKIKLVYNYFDFKKQIQVYDKC